MFLTEYLMSHEINEFDSSFKFLVSQYSSLLYTPECYTVDPTTNVVILNKNLFSEFKGGKDFDLTNSIEIFEQHLVDKLSADLSIRRERRLSSIGQRPRLPSIKRPGEENLASKSKIAKPVSSQSSSS